MFLVLETFENMWANQKTLFPQQKCLTFVGKHFCFLGSKFHFYNNVSWGWKGNIERKYNVSGTTFPSLSRALVLEQKELTTNCH